MRTFKLTVLFAVCLASASCNNQDHGTGNGGEGGTSTHGGNGGGGASASSSSGSTGGGFNCPGLGQSCSVEGQTCTAGSNVVVCHCGRWDSDANGSCGTGSSSSSGGTGGECILEPTWVHYAPDSVDLSGHEDQDRGWIGGKNGEWECQPSWDPGAHRWSCPAQFCKGDTFTFSLELVDPIDESVQYPLSPCAFPGMWCDGKGDFCVVVAGGKNARVWLTVGSPDGQVIWSQGNTGANIGSFVDNKPYDNLDCSRNGEVTLP